MQAIASRPGTCALCPLPIVSGELIRRDGKQRWIHVRCGDERQSPRHAVQRRRPRERSAGGTTAALPHRR
jgi:hypothetical protein